MLMPDKHITFSESLLGLGGYILEQLKSPRNVDQLWGDYQADCDKRVYAYRHSFDTFILAILFLLGIQAVREKDSVLSISGLDVNKEGPSCDSCD